VTEAKGDEAAPPPAKSLDWPRVESLLPGLARRGGEIEQLGELPPDVVAALRSAGVWRTWLPRELGGFETAPREVVDLVVRLAEADAATGWCAMIGIGSATAAAVLPREGAEEMWSTGDEVCGGALAPTGTGTWQPDGTLLVEGRWGFGSGVRHCDWVFGGVRTDGGPVPALAAFPGRAVEVLDTWHVLGLGGTGSDDYAVHAVPVPRRRTQSMAGLHAWAAGPMWRVPITTLLLALTGAVPVGIARRALAELVRLAEGKTAYRSAGPLRERETVQLLVGQGYAQVEAAQAALAAALDHLVAEAAGTGSVSARARISARLAAAGAAHRCADVVTACYRAGGTTAMAAGHPLSRALRDANTATQHYAVSTASLAQLGGALLGLDLREPF
jgi:alkylation response protein AidB-like acyl-CoA dehydrogenase